MPASERAGPTSVRALVAADQDDETLVAEMAARLPDGGLAVGRISAGHRLLRATYRVLDSQILASALTCLDQDVAGPVATWLTTYRNVRQAAQRTVDDAERRETAVLRKPHELTSSQELEVVVHVGESEIATFPFRLAVTIELAETAVVLRGGAIEQVDCEACEITAELTFADASLWKGAVPPVVLHLPVRPPVRVPLVPVPRPSSPATPVRRQPVSAPTVRRTPG